MKKAATAQQIEHLLHDGMTIMIGGFMATGAPERLIDLLIQKDIRDITLITTDTGSPILSFVASLNWFVNSPIFTPADPKIGPNGGAGVAFPPGATNRTFLVSSAISVL